MTVVSEADAVGGGSVDNNGDNDPDNAVLSREDLIIDSLVHLADTLVDDYDVFDFLHFLTERCVELVDADEAAIMLADPTGKLQPVSSSSERSRLLELFELQNHDGPCLDAFRTGEIVIEDDLEQGGERWPTFSPRALAVGFVAVHSVPLRLRQETVGALNLLRVHTGRLDSGDARLAKALTDVATIGLIQERTIREAKLNASGLQRALNSRVRIEQAKGIVAERAGVDIDVAFELVRGYARRHGLRLSDVVERIVQGTLNIAEPA